MMDEDCGSVSKLLAEVHKKGPQALDDLIQRIYEEFRPIARQLMLGERVDHTLSTDDLLDEALAKVVGNGLPQGVRTRKNLSGYLVTIMRHILLDHAKKRDAFKRGLGQKRVPLDDALEAYEAAAKVRYLDLHEALQILEREDYEAFECVTLHFFLGMSYPEISTEVRRAPATIGRDLRRARTRLFQLLSPSGI